MLRRTPSLSGWEEWRARARAINNGVVTAGEDAVCHCPRLGSQNGRQSKSKAKPTLKSQKPKPGWRPRTRPREIVLCSAVDTADCPLLSASSACRMPAVVLECQRLKGTSTRAPWRLVRRREALPWRCGMMAIVKPEPRRRPTGGWALASESSSGHGCFCRTVGWGRARVAACCVPDRAASCELRAVARWVLAIWGPESKTGALD